MYKGLTLVDIIEVMRNYFYLHGEQMRKVEITIYNFVKSAEL